MPRWVGGVGARSRDEGSIDGDDDGDGVGYGFAEGKCPNREVVGSGEVEELVVGDA